MIPAVGFARPRLWFSDHIFGFTGLGPHAAYWSFPSGHSVTAGALAFALSLTVPRLTPAWIVIALMIAASRVFLDAHYLSDVIAGFYIGTISAWAMAAGLRASGVCLGPSPASVSASNRAGRRPSAFKTAPPGRMD